MKKYFTLFLLACSAYAGELRKSDKDKIADAIYRIEGGRKAKVPYGILSLPVRGEPHARQICINTIQNNWKRWQQTDGINYFEFLGNRYCPPSADAIGNARWKTNIQSVLGKEFVKQINEKK
jgi:hypothetical protein